MFTIMIEELVLKGEGTVLLRGTEVLDIFGLDMFATERQRQRLDPEHTDLLYGLLSAGSVRGLKITQSFGSTPHYKLRVCFDRRASASQLVATITKIASLVGGHMPVPALVGQFTGG